MSYDKATTFLFSYGLDSTDPRVHCSRLPDPPSPDAFTLMPDDDDETDNHIS